MVKINSAKLEVLEGNANTISLAGKHLPDRHLIGAPGARIAGRGMVLWIVGAVRWLRPFLSVPLPFPPKPPLLFAPVPEGPRHVSSSACVGLRLGRHGARSGQ